MGIQTLAQFQSDLVQASGNRTLDAAQMARWVNAAIAEFAYAFKFPELEKVATLSTSSGVVSYAMPADFRAMMDTGVRIIGPQNRFGGILENESRANYLRSDRYPTSSSQGQTRSYHVFQKKIWIRPAPDGIITSIEFDYWGRFTQLAVPTDVSPFDEDWDDIILNGAMAKMHRSYGEHDRMLNIYNLFLGGVRSRTMASDLEEFPEGGISMIQNEWDNFVR